MLLPQKKAASGPGDNAGSVICILCQSIVCRLSNVRLVRVDARDTPLVIRLHDLCASVRQTRPHHEGSEFPFKKGKILCVCSNNLGNIQDNVRVPDQVQDEVGLLKCKSIAFWLPDQPSQAHQVDRARDLANVVRPRINTALRIECHHVLQASKAMIPLLEAGQSSFVNRPQQFCDTQQKDSMSSVAAGVVTDASTSSASQRTAAKSGFTTSRLTDATTRETLLNLSTGRMGESSPAASAATTRDRQPHQLCRQFQAGCCKFGERCRFLHEVSTSRGVTMDQKSTEDDPFRRFFDRCTRDSNFQFTSEQQAIRFCQAIEAYQDEDLPWRLARRGEHGLTRMIQAMQFSGFRGAICVVRALMNPRWKHQQFETALALCVDELFKSPRVVENLIEAAQRRHLSSAADLKAIADFGTAIAFGIPDALDEHHDVLLSLARTVRDITKQNAATAAGNIDPSALAANRSARRLREILKGSRNFTMLAVSPAAKASGSSQARWPGGRHSNDHRNFREIQIAPTIDELVAADPPFLPPPDSDFLANDPQTRYLDRQFRLLREDMTASVREALKGTGGSCVLSLAVRVEGAEVHEYLTSSTNADADGLPVLKINHSRGSVGIRFEIDLESIHLKGRHLVAELQRTRQLQLGSLVLIKCDDTPTAVGRVVRAPRDPDEFNPASANFVGVVFNDNETFTLLRNRGPMQMMGLAGSFFAYEPVLECLKGLSKVGLPFQQEVLSETRESPPPEYPGVERVLPELQGHLGAQGIQLDPAQNAAFEHALRHRMSLIVGPPGTGKSFIGEKLVLSILRATQSKILVVCYTNHALDQFLCKLLDAGERRFVRLGGKSKEEALEQFALHKLKRSLQRAQSKESRRQFWELNEQCKHLASKIKSCTAKLMQTTLSTWKAIVDVLDTEDPEALEDLTVPLQDSGFQVADGRGGKIKEDYLWLRWRDGKDPSPFHALKHRSTWQMSQDQREALASQWLLASQKWERAQLIRLKKEYNAIDADLSALQQIDEGVVLRQARVIGATTTGAAKFSSLLKEAGPHVLVVEEAGEVLEAHVMASLSAMTVKHTVLIGDHQQLRPKVETHALTVAAQQGFDLNCSLFERLILAGQPYQTLQLQHRMRPEISEIARHMTYPELRDHPGVQNRENLRGVAANVVFIDHQHLENQQSAANSLVDTQSLSKENAHEATMAVQIVHFLLLQGYKPEQIVALVPYLGQLKLINSELRQSNLAAEIGERDTEDLLRIGVDQPWQLAGNSRNSIRVSTIDNYQGEEADIIVASLVRSNVQGSVGFLGKADAEQRVNVLCTRARLGLILVGNKDCFLNASPPSAMWKKLLRHFELRGAIFAGLPIKCQQHQELCDPSLVDTAEKLARWNATGAGCGRPCGAILPCGHVCPYKCHPWSHETVKCDRPVRVSCTAGLHRIEKACSSESVPCCHETVIQNCALGHPVVRICGREAQGSCKICVVLSHNESDRGSQEAKKAEGEVRILTEYAEKVVLLSSETQRLELRDQTRRDLAALEKQFEVQSLSRDRAFAARLDAAATEAQEAVARALERLSTRQLEDDRRLRARMADTAAHLERVAEQMEMQRQNAREAVAAEMKDRDARLQGLHDALAAGLAEDEAEAALANHERPSTELVQERLDEVRRMVGSAKCSICMEEVSTLEGLFCRPVRGHFVCKDCFSLHVKSEAERLEFAGDVFCPFRSPAMGGCNSDAYVGCVVARSASAEAFAVLEKKRLEIKERTIAAEMERDFEERLRRLQLQEATVHRKHILENILTLKCPRQGCGQAFVDFEGCFALKCARQGCGCGFCAWCLHDCGKDAHEHVRSCAHKLNTDAYFGTPEDFRNAHSLRCSRKAKEYLDTLNDKALAKKILDSLAKEFQDLGIKL